MSNRFWSTCVNSLSRKLCEVVGFTQVFTSLSNETSVITNDIIIVWFLYCGCLGTFLV